MSSNKYQTLFSIHIGHDYYGSEAFDDLIIVPSEETITLFKNHKIIYRTSENVVVVMIQSIGGIPAIPFNEEIVFRFYMSLKNTSFLNFSSLALLNVAGKAYYLSNRKTNIKDEKFYLSSPVAEYNDLETYEVGSIVSKDSRVFECIQANSNSEKHNTGDNAFWRDIVIHQSVFLQAYSDTQTYKPGHLAKRGEQVFKCIQANSPTEKHDPSDGTFWREITEHAYVSSADLQYQAEIATQTIATYDSTKAYPLKSWVTATKQYFEAIQTSSPADPHPTTDIAFWKEISADYIREKSKFSLPRNTFAVIDIFNAFGEPDDYALFNSNDEIVQKTFSILFKNRSTVWKYIAQKNSVTGINDENGTYSFSNTAVSNEFISNVPIPLTKRALNTLKLTAAINTRTIEVTGLQNPEVKMIHPSNNTAAYKLFSEIYLNY